MAFRTLAALGLAVHQTALAQKCLMTFNETRTKCESYHDESNPMAMCNDDCLQDVNATIAQCQNGETYMEDGETRNVAESVTEVLMMCMDPCMGAYLQIASQCVDIHDENSELNMEKMCSADCKGMYDSFPSECQNTTMPGDTETFGQIIPLMLQMCSPCGSSYMAVLTTCMAGAAEGSFCQQPCSSMYTTARTNCQGAPNMTTGEEGETVDPFEALGTLGVFFVQACNTGGGGSLPSPGFSNNFPSPGFYGGFPSPGFYNNFPSPGMAGGPTPGCITISRAMAERRKAKLCAAN